MSRKTMIYFASAMLCATSFADSVERTIWSADDYYPGGKSKLDELQKEDPKKAVEGKVTYEFSIGKPGWHELNVSSCNIPRIWLDGKYVVHYFRQDVKRDTDRKTGWKIKNLHLSQGKHTLQIMSTHFPARLPDKWSLTEATTPFQMIRAEFVSKDIMRLHEPTVIKVAAGAPSQELSFEIIAENTLTGKQHKLATADFPKGYSEKELNLHFPEEGVFRMYAKIGDTISRPADLGLDSVAIVDTKAMRGVSKDVKRELLHDIDCVKLTDNGRQLSLGDGFWEAFGKTRVTTSPAGAYRESGDNLDSDIRVVRNNKKSKTGFSFDISVPEQQVPYLLEVEYPDDDRRTVNVILLTDNDGPGLHYNQAHLGSGYETGDYYPLSHKMQTHQVLFWADSKEMRVAIMSMNPGMRSAASKIRVYKLSGVPDGLGDRQGGRIMAAWIEEPGRWWATMRSFNFVTQGGDMLRDFVGQKRMAEMCRFAGYNAINTTEACYQTPTWKTDELEGWFSRGHDAPRMQALFCEKYGLSYIPELHLSAQKWFNKYTSHSISKNRDDILLYDRLGRKADPDNQGWMEPCWNALHPDIQNKYIAIIQELIDSIGDSPAFAGISTRMMTWVWMSWNALPSLNWGYGDWTVGEFTRETGIKVPGDKDDPLRFEKRFDFLTSKETLPKWQKWRADRVMDFQLKIRDTLRRANPKAVLYIPLMSDKAQGMDGVFGTLNASNTKEVLGETGIEVDRLQSIDGIAVAAGGTGCGRRYSTLLNDFKLHSAVNNQDHLRTALSRERATNIGNAYFEDHEAIPIDLLGLPKRQPGAYCGGAEAAGYGILENFSVPMAERDSNFIRTGGLAYCYGQPAFLNDWLKNYEALPSEPFTKFEKATDPVAVWYLNGESKLFGKSKNFCFYAVNKLPVPVTLTLSIENADEVNALAGGMGHKLVNGRLTLTLTPYQLTAFTASPGATLANAETSVPHDFVELNRVMLKSTARLEDAAAGASSESEKAYLARQLDAAWSAFQKGQYWAAKAALIEYPMIELYEKLGVWPEGLIHRKGGYSKLTFLPKARMNNTDIKLIEPDALKKAARTAVEILPSESYNPEWLSEKILVSKDGKFEFWLPVPAAGKYRLSIGMTAKNKSAALVGANGVTAVMQIKQGGQSEKMILPELVVRDGTIKVSILSPDPTFGLYAARLEPVYAPMPSACWMTIGSFNSKTDINYDKPGLKKDLLTDWGPESNLDFNKVYKDIDGHELKWQYSDKVEGRGIETVNLDAGLTFLLRNKVGKMGLCYAATFISSPDDRDAILEVACDWWMNVYLNGEKIVPEPRAKDVETDGAEFTTWANTPAKIRLRKGVNTLLVKVKGGTMSTTFCAWISNPGDLKISHKKD